MVSLQHTLLAAAAFAASALAVPVAAPMPTPAPDLSQAQGKRATSCTFSGSNGYSLASVSQKDCATIVLSALTVPSGVTLDLSDLTTGTTVRFHCSCRPTYPPPTLPAHRPCWLGTTAAG